MKPYSSAAADCEKLFKVRDYRKVSDFIKEKFHATWQTSTSFLCNAYQGLIMLIYKQTCYE